MSSEEISMERAVMICTKYRGVFFGYATDTTGDRVTIKRARNCVYWVSSVRGVFGLAVNGPCEGCRIGPAAEEVELRGVTAVVEVSEKAIAAWEAGLWS